MKIIFSRKGYDDKYGGGCSPIMPDGRMISIPIPAEAGKTGIDYNDIFVENDLSYYELMKKLKIKIPEHRTAHLDPDLRESVQVRGEGWTPAFGQARGAQRHLKNKDVEIGDLFLFFGTFKKVINGTNGELLFDSVHPRHMIFGYLYIGDKYDISREGSVDIFKDNHPELEWLFDHPHLKNDYRKNNVIYAGAKSLPNGCKGAGIFRYNDKLALTKLGYKKRMWELPSFFYPKNGTRVSRNEKDWRWRIEGDNVLWQTVDQGQEFVVHGGEEIEQWATKLIKNSDIY